jgi:hypothetical protein
MSDSDIESELTYNHRIPIAWVFTMNDGQIYEWAPAVQLIVEHALRERSKKEICAKYLKSIGLFCADKDEIDRLAINRAWPRWGEPIDW